MYVWGGITHTLKKPVMDGKWKISTIRFWNTEFLNVPRSGERKHVVLVETSKPRKVESKMKTFKTPLESNPWSVDRQSLIPLSYFKSVLPHVNPPNYPSRSYVLKGQGKYRCPDLSILHLWIERTLAILPMCCSSLKCLVCQTPWVKNWDDRTKILYQSRISLCRLWPRGGGSYSRILMGSLITVKTIILAIHFRVLQKKVWYAHM